MRYHLTTATAIPSSLPSAKISRKSAKTELDTDYQVDREQRICETTYCNEIAQKLLRSMDTSVDPCQDFYRYACGSWEKHNPIPDTELEWSEELAVMQKMHERIRDVLEEPDKPDDILPVKLARKLYRSCMDMDAIEKQKIKSILKILEKAGGFPMATNKPRKRFWAGRKSWQEVDKRYMRLFGSAFFNLQIDHDQNNINKYVLVLNQDNAKQTFAPIFIYTEKLLSIVPAFAGAKGQILDEVTLRDDIKQMIVLALNLEKVYSTYSLNENYKRMTIEELQNWYDSAGVTSRNAKINFLDVIKYTLKLGNVNINASEPIVVYNPEFLHNLARLLGKTSRRTLVNHVQWNFVRTALMYTTIFHSEPRWRVCVDDMQMKNAVSYMFIKKYMSDDSINKAKEMFKNLKKQMRRRITQARWITESGKKSLMQKLDTIVPQIGYPKWYNDQAIIEYYKELNIGSNYLKNVLNCVQNDLIRSIKMYRKPISRSVWMEYPITFNAFYLVRTNTILIPAVKLQDPYFTHMLPDAVNYGTVGLLIGHEISHSFDDKGMKFNSEGVKTDWISQEMFDGFEDKAMCFVKQYNNYTVDVQDENGQNIQVDGNLTLSENIADLIGIQVAFSAYKKVAKQRNQTKLPGLENISNDKLFFLSFANSWCSSINPKYTKILIENDEHSPAKHRVIGSLSNFPKFSRTFGCSRKSPMNPSNKCNLWS